MVFVGVREDLSPNGKLKNLKDGDFESEVVLAGCHSLIYVDKKLIGDPIETLFFQGSHWEYSSIDKTARKRKNEQSVRIRKVYFIIKKTNILPFHYFFFRFSVSAQI
jgi:hypothetical protein